ncbi:hypothetical protein D1171_24695, partial [Escherichia coli]
GPQNDVTLKMPAFEWVHVQLHQQKGMISLSPPTICNSAAHRPVEEPVKRKGSLKPYIFWRFIRRGTHQGAGIKSHSDAG